MLFSYYHFHPHTLPLLHLHFLFFFSYLSIWLSLLSLLPTIFLHLPPSYASSSIPSLSSPILPLASSSRGRVATCQIIAVHGPLRGLKTLTNTWRRCEDLLRRRPPRKDPLHLYCLFLYLYRLGLSGILIFVSCLYLFLVSMLVSRWRVSYLFFFLFFFYSF